ncbi:MAG: phosphate/phosphite/phosphonate ABC transporter substrate-binding protein [Planctomycetota bacterium]
MSDSPQGAISIGRLLKILIPIGLIAVAINALLPSLEKRAQAEFEADMLDRLLGSQLTRVTEEFEFVDEDGDLVGDSPADEDCQQPETLVFSYIAGAPLDDGDGSADWVDLIAALSESTGLPVEYKAYEDLGEQLDAVLRGEVHVVGLGTGATPLAVAEAGVVPVCSPGKSDGSFGYTMKLLTPAESGVAAPDGLKGKKVGFVDPNSNSGFKAALILLLKEHGLQPERDYEWGFTGGHEVSINDLVEGVHDAAPVASDLLVKMIAEGAIEESAVTEIYESEQFPPAVIGFAHNLPATLREAISETLLGFEWNDTTVGAALEGTGAEKFVPVSYKDDWANVRRINEAVAEAKTSVPAS